MLPFPSSVRIYLAEAPCDMRKSFDGLSALVLSALGLDPLSGHLFVFLNRRRDQVRILFFDRTGYAVVAKRLARGTFRRVREAGSGRTYAEVDGAELGLLLEGIDLRGAKRGARWRPPPPEACAP
jgi:transposase